MTRIEFEIAKVYEEELLQVLRNAERIKQRLVALCGKEHSELEEAYYYQEKDCIMYIFQYGYTLRKVAHDSLDKARADGMIVVEKDYNDEEN